MKQLDRVKVPSAGGPAALRDAQEGRWWWRDARLEGQPEKFSKNAKQQRPNTRNGKERFKKEMIGKAKERQGSESNRRNALQFKNKHAHLKLIQCYKSVIGQKTGESNKIAKIKTSLSRH